MYPFPFHALKKKKLEDQCLVMANVHHLQSFIFKTGSRYQSIADTNHHSTANVEQRMEVGMDRLMDWEREDSHSWWKRGHPAYQHINHSHTEKRDQRPTRWCENQNDQNTLHAAPDRKHRHRRARGGFSIYLFKINTAYCFPSMALHLPSSQLHTLLYLYDFCI